MEHASSSHFTKSSDHPWNPSGPTVVTQPPLQTHTFSRTSASPVLVQSASLPDSASRSRNLSPHVEGPQEDAAFNMQRAGGSSEPSNERVKLTKTGRISKAKKGLRVHDCDTCGKRYTRAEHLRRHQLNHSTGSLRCDFPGCNKTFHREDLLSRHKERHLETQVGQSPRGSPQSQSSPEAPGQTRYESVSLPTVSRTSSNVVVSTSSTYASTVGPATSYVSTPNTYSISKPTNLATHYQNISVLPAAPVEGSWGYSSSGNWMASPQYSSSSGYGSPNYGNLTLFAGQPHAQLLDRQRSFSDTSLIEQYLPQQVTTTKSLPSPTPSTIPAYWTEWNTGQQGRDYSVSTAPLTYESRSTFLPRTPSIASFPVDFNTVNFTAMACMQRDIIEGAELGVEQLEDAMGEYYLNQYWEFLHPQYPILHRPTFVLSAAPPILKAAVLAIGSQYLLDWNAKQYSRKLHEHCLKILAKRVQDGYESNRIDDMQAVFLVEVYTQYMNRRTPPSLSNRFKILYHTLSCDASIGSAIPLEGILGLHPQTEELSLPPEWMPLSELLKFLQKRRLRAVCYVFESQKRNLFPPSRDYDCLSGLDLPFVCSTDVWDSATPAEMLQWRDTADFAYVSEVLNGTSPMSSPTSEPFDTFRSALLVAAAKETEPSLLDSARLEQTSSTQLLYLANLLSHYTPLRPLLAVAGETWVMGEKLATNDEYQSLRAQLRAWTTEQGHTDSAAINTALRILRLELNRPPAEAQTFTLIEQWAIYLAALVLWATGYTIQHPKRDPGILPSHKEPTLGEVRIPVHSTLNAIEQGKWKEVVKGNGVMEALKDVRIKINGSSNGLLVEAVLVLGKLVDRGAEEGWF